MDPATAALTGASLGAATGFLSSYLGFRYQLRLEEKKSRIARDETLLKELRSYIAEVKKEMFSALHSMAWVAWHATKELNLPPTLINHELISQYHKEIHSVVPQLLGNLTVVASIDKRAYERLSNQWHELQKIDDKIADAFVNYQKSPEKSLTTLRGCHPEIMELYKSLPEKFADTLQR